MLRSDCSRVANFVAHTCVHVDTCAFMCMIQVDLAKADIKAAKAEAKSQKKARQKIEKEISELAEAVSIERAQFTDRAREHEAAKVILLRHSSDYA
jgi:cell division protein FtsB